MKPRPANTSQRRPDAGRQVCGSWRLREATRLKYHGDAQGRVKEGLGVPGHCETTRPECRHELAGEGALTHPLSTGSHCLPSRGDPSPMKGGIGRSGLCRRACRRQWWEWWLRRGRQGLGTVTDTAGEVDDKISKDPSLGGGGLKRGRRTQRTHVSSLPLPQSTQLPLSTSYRYVSTYMVHTSCTHFTLCLYVPDMCTMLPPNTFELTCALCHLAATTGQASYILHPWKVGVPSHTKEQQPGARLSVCHSAGGGHGSAVATS